jgi:hypothetical protein
MINWYDNHKWLLIACLATALAVSSTATRADWPPPSYQAVYDLYMDGKLRGETRIRFDRDGQHWSFANEAEGLKGLAGFLGAETIESAAGTWKDGLVLPEEFSHRYEIAFRKDGWSARFDWESGKVHTNHDDEELQLPLEQGVVDPLGLTLVMQLRLNQDLDTWEIPIVDEDKIDLQRFRVMKREPVETKLGCLDTVEVERVRENSKRYSSVWFAPRLDFITARMVHGKREGHEFEIRIRELTLNGDPVTATAPCPGQTGS